jgi:integrase/recombinase XerC
VDIKWIHRNEQKENPMQTALQISNPNMAALDALMTAGASPKTGKEYFSDLQQLGRIASKSLHGILESLLSTREQAFVMVGKLRQQMITAGLAPNTINRRLATIRGLLRVARDMGIIGWTMDIKNLRTVNVRNTQGPGVEKIREMLAEVKDTAQGARDRAILALLSTMGLRRTEVTALNIEDIQGSKIRVQRKGSLGYVAMTVPEATLAAINTWLRFRGEGSGPLFTSFDRAGKGDGRLTGRSVARITNQKGGCSPHALRHTAITTAIEMADSIGVEFTECRQFSGHKQIETLLIYRDQIRNTQGRLAEAVAGRMMA